MSTATKCVEINFYYFSLCHVCKKPAPNLKKCANCKCLYYCSRHHQLADWTGHRSICRAISKTSKIWTLGPGASVEDFNHYKYTWSLLWRYELGRDLENAEHHMWMFPKMCLVCYSTEAEVVCQDCLCVAYCCHQHQESHREIHAKCCADLKLCLRIQTVLCQQQLSVDWLKININKEALNLPNTLEGVIKLLGYENPRDNSIKHVDYIVMTEYFCAAINLLFGLEKSNFLARRLAKRDTIVLHVVGPDLTEHRMSWVLILEFLAHWILNLKTVKLFLIGPELPVEEVVNVTLKCPDCRARGFAATMFKIKGLYHDHVNFIGRPDLVVAFNSGLHEFNDSKTDTWKKSISKFVQHKGVPAMLTAYTENELKSDLERFKQNQVSYLMKPQRNPYSSLRPNRNWEEGSEPVFYQNGYIAIITKKIT